MANILKSNTKFIVIKSKGNSGKTTTIWLVYLELLKQGATVLSFSNTFHGNSYTIPNVLPPANNIYDFVAEVVFNKKRIVIVSQGDTPDYVDNELQKILPTSPNFIVCASRSQYRTDSTWELFETKYTNLLYDRICLWSEYTTNAQNKLIVKNPTIEVIVKYIS